MRDKNIEQFDVKEKCFELELFETSELESYTKSLPFRKESIFLVSTFIVLNRLSFKRIIEVEINTKNGAQLYNFVGDEAKTVDTILKEMDDLCVAAKCQVENESYEFFLKDDRYFCRIIPSSHDKKFFEQQFFVLYRRIFCNMLKNVDLLIKDIKNVSQAESDYLLYSYNKNNCTFKLGKNAVDYLLYSFENYSGNRAVESGDFFITYEQLEQEIKFYIAFLEEKGVKNGDIVSICYHKSIEMMVAMLAIICKGAIVEMVDGTLPIERLKYMYEDANPKLTLTDGKTEEFIQFLDKYNFKYENDKVIREQKYSLKVKPISATSIQPHDLAVVIYTSGTTGRPKGIMFSHENILSSVVKNFYIHTYQTDRRLQVSNYIFDGFLFDTFATLFYGACLVMMHHENAGNPVEIANTFIEKKITKVFLITPLLNAIADINIDSYNQLNRLYFGGETASLPHVRKVLKHIGPGKLCNVYGPTETSMMSTIANIDREEQLEYDVPIGEIIDNKTVYIVDQYGNILPKNVFGEIYIGGYGLTKGYINNEKETKSRFIEKLNFESGKVYKTGDYGYIDQNDVLHFLGRIDDQIKIRGYRIELGDIEQAVNEYDKLNQAYVILTKQDEVVYLACFYLADEEIDVKELKKYLSVRIPEYMIPGKYYRLEKFPYTPAGKIDRKKLTSLFLEILSEKKTNIVAHDKIEEVFLDIICNTLNLSPMSMDDSFFELGGDSLSVHILCSQIDERLGCFLEYLKIFQVKTLQNIVSLIRDEQSVNKEEIFHEAKQEFYPLSKAQERLLTVCMKNRSAIKTAYNNIFLIDFIGKIDFEKLKVAINKEFNRHRVLKTMFVLEENSIVQKINDDYWIEPEIVTIDESELEDKVYEFSVPFKMLNQLLFRCEILLYGKEKGTIVFDFHHTIFDGMCIELFSSEILQLYFGEEPEKLAFDYLDFCLYEKKKEQKIDEKSQKYWMQKKQIFSKWDANLYGKCMKDSHGFVGERKKYLLFNDALNYKTHVKNLKSTSYQIMLANYVLTMAHEMNSDYVVLGTVSAGRDLHGTEKLVGVFVETIPIIVKIDRESTFKDFLVKIEKNVMKAFSNKTSLEQINALFDNQTIVNHLFVYQNLGVQSIVKDGVTFTPSGYSLNKGIKYSILFEVFEEEGGMYANVEYAIRLFSEKDMNNFVECFSEIVKKAIEQPDMLISDLLAK